MSTKTSSPVTVSDDASNNEFSVTLILKTDSGSMVFESSLLPRSREPDTQSGKSVIAVVLRTKQDLKDNFENPSPNKLDVSKIVRFEVVKFLWRSTPTFISPIRFVKRDQPHLTHYLKGTGNIGTKISDMVDDLSSDVRKAINNDTHNVFSLGEGVKIRVLIAIAMQVVSSSIGGVDTDSFKEGNPGTGRFPRIPKVKTSGYSDKNAADNERKIRLGRERILPKSVSDVNAKRTLVNGILNSLAVFSLLHDASGAISGSGSVMRGEVEEQNHETDDTKTIVNNNAIYNEIEEHSHKTLDVIDSMKGDLQNLKERTSNTDDDLQTLKDRTSNIEKQVQSIQNMLENVLSKDRKETKCGKVYHPRHPYNRSFRYPRYQYEDYDKDCYC